VCDFSTIRSGKEAGEHLEWDREYQLCLRCLEECAHLSDLVIQTAG